MGALNYTKKQVVLNDPTVKTALASLKAQAGLIKETNDPCFDDHPRQAPLSFHKSYAAAVDALAASLQKNGVSGVLTSRDFKEPHHKVDRAVANFEMSVIESTIQSAGPVKPLPTPAASAAACAAFRDL